jgi:DHA1 family tetracycline resistance protein-like MFS transporter
MTAATPNRPPLLPLLTVNFIGTLGYSIIIPFLVYLVEGFGGNAVVYGVLGATYSAFQLVGAPILGRWSDRFGRKRILLLSQLGTFLSWVIFAVALFLPARPLASVQSALLGTFAVSLPLLLLFVARAFDGLTGGNVSVANAYLADVSNEENRNRNFGLMSISANLGFVLGPALAGLLGASATGELLPVLAAMGISFAAVFIILVMLPESRPCAMGAWQGNQGMRKVFGQEHKECYKVETRRELGLVEALRIPQLPLYLVLYFLIFLGFNVFYTAFPVHAVRALGWPVSSLGIFFSILSGVMILFQGPVLGRLSRRVSEATLVLVGSAILAVCFFLLAFPSTVLTFLSALFFAAGNGLMWPSFLSLLSKRGGTEVQGAVQGIASSAGSLASIVGLILGGVLYEVLGPATFFVSGGVIVLVFLLSIRIRVRRPTALAATPAG